MSHGLLKIILKVKDEPELFRRWIEYHASIVGYDNLLVFDCGSQDTKFLETLRSYYGRVNIQSYTQYYDQIHQYDTNRSIYDALVGKTKYVIVLDCDEFLFATHGGFIHPSHVLRVLDESIQAVVCGTWFNNTEPPVEHGPEFDWTRPFVFALEESAIFWGSKQGKAIVRADFVSRAKYVGHNIGDKRLGQFITTDSFGKIGIFHLSTLALRVARRRSFNHLVAKQVVQQHLPNDQIDKMLREYIQASKAEPIELLYIRRYFGLIEAPKFANITFMTMLLNGGGPETHSKLVTWTNFDYAKIVAEANPTQA